MILEQFTTLLVLVVSFALSGLYSIFLQHIHDLYFPDHIWLTVVAGNGFIVGTLMVLEADFGIAITSALVLQTNVAWGLPIIIWQIWQWRRRWRQNHAITLGR